VSNARESRKRGAGSNPGQRCLPLQTILRVNSLACTAESAIFLQIAEVRILVRYTQAEYALVLGKREPVSIGSPPVIPTLCTGNRTAGLIELL
jgi:hypothetical protein